MHTVRNLTLEDFYLLNRLHSAAPASEDAEDEIEDEEEEEGEEESEEEGEDDEALVVEDGDEEDDDEDEDEEEEDDVDDTDAQADSSSVHRLMVSSPPLRRRSPAVRPLYSGATARRRTGTRGR